MEKNLLGQGLMHLLIPPADAKKTEGNAERQHEKIKGVDAENSSHPKFPNRTGFFEGVGDNKAADQKKGDDSGYPEIEVGAFKRIPLGSPPRFPQMGTHD